jgi:predicted AAA+ superfamily ATPase
MKDVFKEISRNIGQEINKKATATKCKIDINTFNKYFDILEHMNLIKKLDS